MGKAKRVFAAFAAAAISLTWGALAAQSTTQDPSGASGSGIIRIDRCTTAWADTRVVSSKIPGKIDRRLVADGQAVEEGEVLAMLDARDAELELAIQEILGNSDLDEKSQKQKLDEYLARLDTAAMLYPHRAISEEEWRLAKVNVRVNEFMTLKETEKRLVEQKKAERARVFLDDHVIRSPMRGIIKKCFKREKESVTNSDLQLFDIVATDKVWVEGQAEVSDIFRIRVGQEVVVKLAISRQERTIPERQPTSPGLRSTEVPTELPQEKIPFPGKIVFIKPDADALNSKFIVRAEVDNQFDPETGDPILRAGLNTVMKISVSK
jgi:multidrug efflux pump subunit AcrA (membrane-fusion protein)